MEAWGKHVIAIMRISSCDRQEASMAKQIDEWSYRKKKEIYVTLKYHSQDTFSSQGGNTQPRNMKTPSSWNDSTLAALCMSASAPPSPLSDGTSTAPCWTVPALWHTEGTQYHSRHSCLKCIYSHSCENWQADLSQGVFHKILDQDKIKYPRWRRPGSHDSWSLGSWPRERTWMGHRWSWMRLINEECCLTFYFLILNIKPRKCKMLALGGLAERCKRAIGIFFFFFTILSSLLSHQNKKL